MRFLCHSPCCRIPAPQIFLLPGSLLAYPLLAFMCNENRSEAGWKTCLHWTPNMVWFVVVLISCLRYAFWMGPRKKQIENKAGSILYLLCKTKHGALINFPKETRQNVIPNLQQCSLLHRPPCCLRRDVPQLRTVLCRQGWAFPHCIDNSCHEAFICVSVYQL